MCLMVHVYLKYDVLEQRERRITGWQGLWRCEIAKTRDEGTGQSVLKEIRSIGGYRGNLYGS